MRIGSTYRQSLFITLLTDHNLFLVNFMTIEVCNPMKKMYDLIDRWIMSPLQRLYFYDHPTQSQIIRAY